MEKETLTNNHEDYISLEKKLGDLMMRGWTLLADSCPAESCGVPLMKSPNGQKYCVGCEAWHFEKERPQKQKYTDLVSLQGKQNIQLKPTDLQNMPKQNINSNYTFPQNVLQSLQYKLVYYSRLLNDESNTGKSKEILECMKLCMENIVIASKLI